MMENWIKARRERLGINQEELATRLQLNGFTYTRASISHWEVGRNQPPLEDPEFRQVLATALKLSVIEMLQMAGYEIADDDQTTDELRVVSIMKQLTPARRKLAVGILEQLLREGEQL